MIFSKSKHGSARDVAIESHSSGDKITVLSYFLKQSRDEGVFNQLSDKLEANQINLYVRKEVEGRKKAKITINNLFVIDMNKDEDGANKEEEKHKGPISTNDDFEKKVSIYYFDEQSFHGAGSCKAFREKLQKLPSSKSIKTIILFSDIKQKLGAESIKKKVNDSKKVEGKPNSIHTSILCSEEEFTEMLIHLNIDDGLDYYVSEGSKDAAEFLVGCLSTIADSMYKKPLGPFEAKGRAHTEKCRLYGLENYYELQWVDMLMAIPGISEEKAIAVAKAYPTIRNLMEAYQNQNTKEEMEKMLEEVKVIYNFEESKKKNLGKAISSKIFKIFTSWDPNQVLIK